jgi:hypothetical protein
VSHTFDTTLLLGGKTATGFEVPEEVVAALGSGKRPAVSVTINGFTYRTTIAPMGGKFLVPVSAGVREAAGVAAGDRVAVELELDTAPRVIETPSYLAAARDRFEALSYSRKKEIVRSIEDAKTEETRQRRIAKALEELGT